MEVPAELIPSRCAVRAGLAVDGRHRRRDARGGRDPRDDGLHLDRPDARSSPGCTPSSSPPWSSPCWAPRGCSSWVRTRRPRRSWPPGWPVSASPGCTPDSAGVGGLLQPGRAGLRRPAGPGAAAAAGFLGDFLSASVLIGFLTGVGIQVLPGRSPTCSASPRARGNWFEQQWHWITHLGDANAWATFAFGAAHDRDHPGLQAVPARGPGRHRRGRPARSSSRR